MSDCISCELFLEHDQRRCPGCGTEQELQKALADEARCSLHPEVQATGTCARCGRFTCVGCAAVDAGVCRSCLELTQRDVRARLDSFTVRIGWVAVVQGLVAPALSFRSGALFWLMAVTGAFSVFFGLLTVARRELWIVGVIAAGLLGLFSFFALFDAPLLGVCLVLTVVQWRLITRSGPLEREVFLLSNQ